MINQDNAKLIIENRKLSAAADTAELKNKRQNFLNFLKDKTRDSSNRKERIPGMNTKYKTKGLGFDERIVYTDNYGFRVLEMYQIRDTVFKSEPLHMEDATTKQLHINTRTKIKSETSCESDKLSFKEALALTCKIGLNLMNDNYHFAIFLAKGARSPWIKIFDLDELNDLSPQQRIFAQISFWRKYVPFGFFQYIDTGVFVDEHYQLLEFAPHWRHHTPFDLLFEYIPASVPGVEVKPKVFGSRIPKVISSKSLIKNHICPNHNPLNIQMYETIENKWLCAWCEFDKFQGLQAGANNLKCNISKLN